MRIFLFMSDKKFYCVMQSFIPRSEYQSSRIFRNFIKALQLFFIYFCIQTIQISNVLRWNVVTASTIPAMLMVHADQNKVNCHKTLHNLYRINNSWWFIKNNNDIKYILFYLFFIIHYLSTSFDFYRLNLLMRNFVIWPQCILLYKFSNGTPVFETVARLLRGF